MAQNIGTLITAAIRPNDDQDLISSAFQNEIKGGHHGYPTILERDTLIEARREWGMYVTVYNDNTSNNNGTYELKYNNVDNVITNNNNWLFVASVPQAGPDGTILMSSGGTVVWSAITSNNIVVDTYISGATLNATNLDFDMNGSLSAFTVDLTSFLDNTDTFITGQTFNTGNYQLTTSLNNNTLLISDLSILSTDMIVTGGTYDINTGIVSFTNNSGGTFDVTGFSSGMTDSYTTGTSLSGTVLTFDNNLNGSNFYNIDLFPILTATTGLEIWSASTGTNSAVLAGTNAIASGLNSVSHGQGTTASGPSSHAEGNSTIASGTYSHAEGANTNASGFLSHASGTRTIASGYYSNSNGADTTASGVYSHAEGQGTMASNYGSHAEGGSTTASGAYSHAEGFQTTASGAYSHAEGSSTNATGNVSHAEGNTTIASGVASHAEGSNTNTTGAYSHAEGFQTTAIGLGSHAEGNSTTATGNYSHAEGFNTNAIGTYSHAEGANTIASGTYGHAEGYSTNASGFSSHASGTRTIASGYYSNSNGADTTASGVYSHAEGQSTMASNYGSHAEGGSTTASGAYSHAEGNSTIASGAYSHAEGYSTNATGNVSHVEGYGNNATGVGSHAEGSSTNANGLASHAEGRNTNANGLATHAEGSSTNANGHYSHAGGRNTTASGNQSFSHGYNNIAIGLNSAVIGGRNITGTTDNTTYVPKFNIQSLSTGTSITNLGWDVDGNVVSGSGNYIDSIIYVNNKTGNDNTGLIGSRTTAFKTIKSARDYGTAFSGSTIYVMEGVYIDEHNLQRNGNYYFEQETYVYVKRGSNGGGTRNALFYFTTNPPNLPYTDPIYNSKMHVHGHGNFIGEPALDWLNGGWMYPMIWNDDAGSDVYFECDTIKHHTVGGAIRLGGGSMTLNINDGIYSLPLSGGSSINGISIQLGGDITKNIDFNITCPYMLTNHKGIDIDKSGSGSTTLLDFGLIESSYNSIDPIIQIQPTHVNNQGIYNFNINTIINHNHYGISSVDCESGIWNFNIGQLKTKGYSIYTLNRGNITNSGDTALQMNFNIGQAISEQSTSIHIFNQQNDARYYFNGNFRTLVDNSNTIHVNNNNNGLVQFDGTYINEGTGSTGYGIYIDAGETPPILGDVKIYSKAAAIASGGLSTVEVRGSAWFETEPTSAITISGNYTLSGVSYVSKFNIQSLSTGTSITNLGWDVDGNVVSGSTSGGGGTSPWSASTGTNSAVLKNSTSSATAIFTVAEGQGSIASGGISHAEGGGTTASGYYSHAEGSKTEANNLSSHAEGRYTTASGYYGSHAEGFQTTASGLGSHAEGYSTMGNGDNSHSEGYNTTASGGQAHAEGNTTIASGYYGSHAEGWGTNAFGLATHAEGYYTNANGHYSHAGGRNTTASGNQSFSHGHNNIINNGATNSVILGGSGNTVNTNVINSSIIGGQNITATMANTTYLERLNIKTITSGNTIEFIGVLPDGTIVTPIPTIADDDIDAGLSGVTSGKFYQTSGNGLAPLNIAGIIMIKQ